MKKSREQMAAEYEARWAAIDAEWDGLPDDETTACGMPLGVVHPELYDENNQLRDGALNNFNADAH
ncbi:hypothetical protein H0194_04630 [Corynebacterium incognita]|uniref:Uncharacterized protein n=1 Tax=Corynebacterium incognita TaxID=2754725 RepID=A0A7G7CRQ3_9CORY|nr:hypothetical protein [Corynebacterium incognita]QNE90269.1 hypothetical protein H0194_04630 [Corynebacterium incognita]